ncbi:ATP-binding protein [Actinomadura sp. 6N118]|uniref:ATP-binding protein n=1 Tax=Actinomadura sp. 6N118 TaxID=3375151 RepID=UPI0037976744
MGSSAAQERRLLDGLVAAAAVQAASLVMLGEPGIGKTALLDYVAVTADVRALRARGIESEAVLPFATLGNLVLPIRKHMCVLPGGQRRALEISLAIADGEAANPYAPCIGTLNLIAAATEDRPIIILVDDLQWVDPASQQVLMFVARRVLFERVVFLFAAGPRPPPGARDTVTWAGLPSVEIDRRRSLGDDHTRMIAQLLLELIPGGAKKNLSAAQAKALLANVRPRDAAGKVRRRVAAELISDLERIYRRSNNADRSSRNWSPPPVPP